MLSGSVERFGNHTILLSTNAGVTHTHELVLAPRNV